jgi:hypothetical protein
MSIKIDGTTVIDQSRHLANITDCDAKAFAFYPSAATITSTINFTTPFMTCNMTGDTTFTVSGESEGKSAILCLDTTTDAHTPSWPDSFNWDFGVEPPSGAWAAYRKWQIHMYCHSVDRIDVSEIGFDLQSSQPTEAVGLSGTSANPVTFFDMAGSNNNDLVMGWKFDSDGNIYKYESIYNVGGQGTYLHTSTQWNNITPSQTYYIRVANHSGTKNVSTGDSDALNSWIALTSDREYRVRDSRDLLSYADENMVIKVEISTTSNGSNIVATGYYECEYSGLA